jgi:hypothetical protein
MINIDKCQELIKKFAVGIHQAGMFHQESRQKNVQGFSAQADTALSGCFY